jgi:hypothetical protein
MPTKDKETTEQTADTTPAPPQARESGEVADKLSKEELEQGWTAGEWRGVTVYRCLLCPFDAVDNSTQPGSGQQVIEDHVFQHRRTAPQAMQFSPVLYDRYGNPMPNPNLSKE